MIALLAIAAYLTVATLVWVFGSDLVGESAIGRKALPVASALWPIGLALLAVIALVAAFDATVTRLLDQTLGGGDGE
ncbi:MAG: hypothetical protein J0I69_02820 [Altererythrobacter sp.]|nr:hypothetical protein [Altererythrobacter sp.]OJU60951.1 MAG: hypothetical protein BGO08_12560 [Altererythrobacter sp. 66-12]